MASMRESLRLLDGEFSLRSLPGQGTTLRHRRIATGASSTRATSTTPTASHAATTTAGVRQANVGELPDAASLDRDGVGVVVADIDDFATVGTPDRAALWIQGLGEKTRVARLDLGDGECGAIREQPPSAVRRKSARSSEDNLR